MCPQDTILRTERIPMASIILKIRYAVKQRLLKNLRRCRSAGMRLRYVMIINVLNGRSGRATAEVLQVHNTTVYRVLERFQAYGEAGLADGRADNGADKLDDNYLNELYRVARATPQDYGWQRPTLPRQQLIQPMLHRPRIPTHVTTSRRSL